MGHDHGDHHHPHDHDHGPNDFTEIKPILSVANVAASLNYYTQTLGFVLEFAWSNEERFDHPAAPTFAEVRRGQAALMLAQNDQGSGVTWVYIDVASAEELNALHAAYAARGARIAAAPEDKPWNRREMLVNDLDGHTLRLGAPRAHHD